MGKYKSLIVAAILAGLYVFAIVYYSPFIPEKIKIICAVPIVCGIVIYITKVEAWIESGRFWIATLMMAAACAIVLAIGAQSKVDPPTWLPK